MPPGGDPNANIEEVLLSGESFAHLSDLYAISCSTTSLTTFLEPSDTVEECNSLDTVAYIQRTIVDDSNSDPNLDCPTIPIIATPGTAVEEDYGLESATVTFNLNEISREVPIDIICDEITGEGDETFTIDTVPASSSPFSVIIRDFTSHFLFDKSVYSVMEGESHVTVTVLRQGYLGIAGHVFVIPSSKSSDEAEPWHDFDASNLKAEFNIGQADFNLGEAKTTVNIQILDDDVLEGTETFTVELHTPYPLPQTSIQIREKCVVNITDDDFEIKLNNTHYTVAENASSIKIPILRIGYVYAANAIVLPVETYENPRSATDGVDFQLLQNTVTFSKGESVQYIEIKIMDDKIGETNEAFRLVVTDPTKGVVALLETHIGIADDDVTYSFSSGVYDTNEMNGLLRIPITRVGSSDFEDTLYVVIHDETASSGDDFKDRGRIEVKFEKDDTSKAVFIDILEDDLGEGTETFTVTLIGANEVELDTARVVILDNDPLPLTPGKQVYSFELSSDLVSEDDGHRRLGVVRTQFEHGGSVVFSTESGTAKNGYDFIGISEELILFNPGQERVFTPYIQIINDGITETDEIFTGHLSNPSDGVVSNQSAVITIRDDDAVDVVDLNESSGFNVSGGVLAAIIITACIATLTRLSVAVCGCLMMLKKQTAASPTVPLPRPAPAFIPYTNYEMRTYHQY